MSLSTKFASGLAVLALSGPAFAEIIISDPYARASSPVAMSGAAFMAIENTGDVDDRVIAASSDAAQRVELHTHIEDGNGVMRMVEVEDGFAVAAGETHMLQRGGDHVMMMGLTAPFVHGEQVEITLTFEQAGDVTITVPIDLERQPMGAEMMMDHDSMDADG